jgi:O-antigen/teichoic acid export membrane protein
MFARLSRHTIILIISNVGGAVTGFTLSLLIGRVLGETGLGRYAVVMAWITPLVLLVNFGLSTLTIREVAQNDAAAAYVHKMALIRLCFGGSLMLVLIVCAPLLSRDPFVVAGLRLSAPLVLVQPFFNIFTTIFRARGVMYPIPWLNIGMLFVQVIMTAVVFMAGAGIIAALIVNLVTSAGQLIAAWLIYRWRFSAPGPDVQLATWALLRRAFPFAIAGVMAALQIRLSVVLLEQMAGTAEAGYFSAANRFVEAGRMLPNAFFGALLPALATLAANPDVLERTFRRAMLALGAFGIVAAVVAIPLSAAVISFTYGAGFSPSVPALQVLMLSLIFSLLRGGRTLYWYAVGREQMVNVANVIGIVIQIILSGWLIPQWGATGAALTVLGVEIIVLALLWVGWTPRLSFVR